MHFAMRVAFATTYDARDPRQWSGIPSQIWKAMEALGVALDPVALDLTVDPLLGRLASASLRATERLRRSGMGLSLTYDPSRSPILARRRARRIDDRLRLHRPDAVFSPGSTVVAKVESSVPIAFWTDAVYPAMLGFYPEFGGHSRTTMRRGMELEREALNRCSVAAYASDWAARGAVELCGADPKRVHVIPFGANLAHPPSREAALAGLDARSPDRCNLLFVGVDWERKGGRFAIDVTRRVRMAGVDARLSIVGCSPPAHEQVPPYVQVHGFLSKTDHRQRAVLEQLQREAHFFILPTRAECFGCVFAEAAAHAVPSLSFRVGGVPTAVRDEVTGKLFPLAAGPDEYSGYILATLADQDRYRKIARAARDDYENRLNWAVSTRRLLELLSPDVGDEPTRRAGDGRQ
jgi:glycosyltransferase involved in cell wall biosynthesis